MNEEEKLRELLGNPVGLEGISFNLAARKILLLAFAKAKAVDFHFLNQPGKVEMTRTEAATILAHSLFKPIGNLNWERILRSRSNEAKQRLACLLSFFETYEPSDEVICFERICLPFQDEVEDDVIHGSNVILHKKNVEDVENAEAIVDFANPRIHIHSIIPSLTQEEVLFSIHSECFLILSMITNELQDDEVVIFRNMRRHATYTGYVEGFRFVAAAPACGGKTIIAMDACMHAQFYQIERDIWKAKIGFSQFASSVSTGRWGCGVFGGNPTLKFLQQVIAGRHLKELYYSDAIDFDRHKTILALLSECKPTISWLIHQMQNPTRSDFFSHMKEQLELKILL